MKKKIALFYNTDTESGKMILDFLSPFEKRKSDIVGRLILKWIEEHGANVPVEWLSRNGDMRGELSLPIKAGGQESPCQTAKVEENRESRVEKVTESGRKEQSHDADLIRAGLASFMGS